VTLAQTHGAGFLPPPTFGKFIVLDPEVTNVLQEWQLLGALRVEVRALFLAGHPVSSEPPFAPKDMGD
jgi:hypothetical protein